MGGARLAVLLKNYNKWFTKPHGCKYIHWGKFRLFLGSMNGENWQLVTDEPVEFGK